MGKDSKYGHPRSQRNSGHLEERKKLQEKGLLVLGQMPEEHSPFLIFVSMFYYDVNNSFKSYSKILPYKNQSD